MQIPEYVKQALQNESYSKVHGLRGLHRSLNRSISRQVLTIDSIRLSLLKNGEMEELDHSDGISDDLEDNRNWELLPFVTDVDQSAVGLGRSVDSAWVKAWSACLRGLKAWLRDEAVNDQEPPSEVCVFSRLFGSD